MRKPLVLLAKIAAALAVLLAIGVAAGTYALQKYLPPEKVRALITENARKVLRREVKIKSLDLNALKGLSLTGLEISETPDFQAGTFAKADAFQLRVRLAPLLHGSVAVDRLAVSGLRLAVKKAADGSFNFSDLAGAKADAPAAKGLPMVLDVRHVAVAGGRVDYADAGTGDKLTLSDLNATITDLALDGDTSADLSFKTQGTLSKRAVQASVAFLGTVDAAKLDLDKASVSMRKASVEFGDIKASAVGSVKGLRSPEFDLKTEVSVRGGASIPADLKGKLADGAVSVALKTRLPALKSDDFKFLGAPEGVLLPAAQIDGALDAAADSARIKSFHLETEGAVIDAAGLVAKLKAAPETDLSVSAKLSAPKIMPALVALLKARKIEAPASLSSRSGDVDTQFHLGPSAVEVKSFHLKSEGSSVNASGRVTGLGTAKMTPEFDIDADLAVPALTSADLVMLKAYKIEVPPDVKMPPAKIAAKLHYTPDEVTVSELKFDDEFAKVSAAGSVRAILSGKPKGTVNGSAKLKLPAVTAKDLAALKLLPKVKVPAGLSWPATEMEAQFKYDGASIDFPKLHVRNTITAIDGSASVKDLGGAPQATVDLKTSLPAFDSDDVAFLSEVPAGLKIPAAKIEVRGSASKSSVDLGFLKIEAGKNQLTAKGTVKNLLSGKPAYNLAAMSSGFVLEELTDLTPQTREMGLKGVGRFKVFVAEVPGLGNAYTGDIEFRGARATVAGISFSDFSGKGAFDKDKLDFKEIAGKIDGSPLSIDFTLKNYLSKPSIDIQKGSIETLDAGKLLAAKEELSKKKNPDDDAALEIKPFSFKIWDAFTIGKLVHPYATIENASLKCNLTGITPDMRQLNGTAAFSVGGGHLLDLKSLAKQYTLVKVLSGPIAFLEVVKVLPNLKEIEIKELIGHYEIENGKIDIKDFHLIGERLTTYVDRGYIDYPNDYLYMETKTKVGPFPVPKVICGPISNPDPVCAQGEAAKYLNKAVSEGPVKDALDKAGQPVQQLLNILKPK